VAHRTSSIPVSKDAAPGSGAVEPDVARPVPLVHVLRGGQVESVHLGHVAVVDVDGRILARAGEPRVLVFPRSSFKPFQALSLVESGAFERSGLPLEALALIAGSHSGTDAHAALAHRILDAAGADEKALGCGTHSPYDDATAAALRARGEEPGPLRHNCSGKHAGMLLFARFLGAPLEGYLDPDHPVQRAIFERFGELVDEPLGPPAIDGCSAPTPRMPLSTLARAFALLAMGVDASGRAAPGLAKIRDAMRTHSFQVAGEGRLDTRLMRAVPGLIAKAGAEAVHATGVPEKHTGIAIKVVDGTRRALEPAVLSVLGEAGVISGDARRDLEPAGAGRIQNHAGLDVGAIQGVARLVREAP
jgi:L-asparaginase II